MSKVWKKTILIPLGVEVKIEDSLISVFWPKWSDKFSYISSLKFSLENWSLNIDCLDSTCRAMWGTTRAIISNIIEWVSVWFEKKLQVIWVGYDAIVQWTSIQFKLWFSHLIYFPIPSDITVKIDKDPKWNAVITLQGFNKQLLWMTCAKIRNLKKPEPYKGKWIRYLWEVIKLKAGKASKK